MQLTSHTLLLGSGVLPIETASFITGRSPELYAPTDAFITPERTIEFLCLSARADQDFANLEMTLPTTLRNSEWSVRASFLGQRASS